MKGSFESLETRKLLSAAVTPVVYTLDTSSKVTTAPFDTIIPIYLAVPKVTAHLTHTGTLTVEGTAGKDSISVLPSEQIIYKKNGDADSAEVVQEITVLGIDGANFNAEDVKRIVVDGGAGNDNIVISSSIKLNATLIGGNGNDTLIGGAGSDLLSGGAGNDKLFAASTTIVGADGKSTVYGTVYAPAYSIYSSANSTVIPGQIAATPKTSTVSESGKTADSLEGGAGDDTLYAGNGPDTVNGGDGKDTLITVSRGTTPPNQLIFRRGDDARSFDGVTLFSIDAINPM